MTKGKHWFSRFFGRVSKDGWEAFGLYYSWYRAFVSNNEDPLGIGRLQLVIPDITGDVVYERWAYPMGVFSGKTEGGNFYGVHVLPEKGDVVWVSFELGNLKAPIWNFGHFGKDEVLKGDDYEGDKSFWFRTPSGHTILVNDTKKKINILHANGQYLEIDDEAISAVSDKKISWGKQHTSNEPAVLGDKNADVLEEIRVNVENLAKALLADATTGSQGAGFIVSGETLTTAAEVLAKMLALKPSIINTKSKIVTLD